MLANLPKSLIILVTTLVFITSCNQNAKAPKNNEDPNLGIKANATFLAGNELYLMGYNLHNLFDTVHDVENLKEKNDIQFLPSNYPDKKEICRKVNLRKDGTLSRYYKYCIETNWSPEKLNKKIYNLKQVINHSGYTLSFVKIGF